MLFLTYLFVRGELCRSNRSCAFFGARLRSRTFLLQEDKMRKILSLLLVLTLVFGLCACGESDVQPFGGEEELSQQVEIPQEETVEQTPQDEKEMSEQPVEKDETPQVKDEPILETSKEETPKEETPKEEIPKEEVSIPQQDENQAQKDPEKLYAELKNWVVENGTVNGDYVMYWTSADKYGGYEVDGFDLTYWSGSENLVFCLNSKVDDNYAVSFFVYVPRDHTGNYEYATSYYLRSTGEHIYYATGVINGADFTKNSPLKADEYIGPVEVENDFKELSRVGICAALDCIKGFLEKENTGYTLSVIGFNAFS